MFLSEGNSLVFIRPHTVGWGGFSSTDICQKLTYINPSFVTIYLSEVDPFILLQPYIWLKSTFFFILWPYIFILWPYIWRKSTLLFFYDHIFGGGVGRFLSATCPHSLCTAQCLHWWRTGGGHWPLVMMISTMVMMFYTDEKNGEVIGMHTIAYYCIVREGPILHLFDILWWC